MGSCNRSACTRHIGPGHTYYKQSSMVLEPVPGRPPSARARRQTRLPQFLSPVSWLAPVHSPETILTQVHHSRHCAPAEHRRRGGTGKTLITHFRQPSRAAAMRHDMAAERTNGSPARASERRRDDRRRQPLSLAGNGGLHRYAPRCNPGFAFSHMVTRRWSAPRPAGTPHALVVSSGSIMADSRKRRAGGGSCRSLVTTAATVSFDASAFHAVMTAAMALLLSASGFTPATSTSLPY
jgi:hypothetical protein